MAITESRSLPPQFVENLGKDYATQLTGLTSLPLDTTKFQPMVAGQDQAQTDAYTMATTQGQGIGSYSPYLQQAGNFQTGTGTFAGSPTNMMGAQDYLNAAQNQSAISQGVNLTVKKKTGKSINEHLISSLDKKATLNNKKKCENINKDQFMDIFFENEEEKNCKNIN